MLTYLKVVLWLADCSPSLSHILAQCVESCVSCYPIGLEVAVPCPCGLSLAGLLGCWVASGLPVPTCGCGAGVEVGVTASTLLPLVRLELCACRHTGMCAPPCPATWLLPLRPVCSRPPGLVAPLSPLALWSGRATSHCLPGVGVVAWPAGVGGSGCAPVGGAGCLGPGHE